MTTNVNVSSVGKKRITAKTLEIMLKHGYGSVQISREHGMNEQQLQESILGIFTKNAAKTFIRRIKENDKKQKREATSKELQSISENEVVNVETINPYGINEDEKVSNENTTVEAAEVEEPKMNDLSNLLKKEETLMEEINSLELNHREIETKRLQIGKSLLEAKNCLEQLLEQVKEKHVQVSKSIEELNSLKETMHKINAEIKEKRVMLKETEALVAKTRQISIFVYENGEVEIVENATGGEIDMSPDTNVLTALKENFQAEDLTIRQMKGIAKAVNLSKNENVKFVFENTIMEEWFNAMTMKK